MGVEKNKVSFTIIMQFMVFLFRRIFWFYILLKTHIWLSITISLISMFKYNRIWSALTEYADILFELVKIIIETVLVGFQLLKKVSEIAKICMFLVIKKI